MKKSNSIMWAIIAFIGLFLILLSFEEVTIGYIIAILVTSSLGGFAAFCLVDDYEKAKLNDTLHACPKCKEIEFGNYCSNCGHKLMEEK